MGAEGPQIKCLDQATLPFSSLLPDQTFERARILDATNHIYQAKRNVLVRLIGQKRRQRPCSP